MSGPALKKRRCVRRIVPTLISSTVTETAATQRGGRESKPRKALAICNKFIWLMLGDFLPSAGYKDYLDIGYDEETQSSLRAQVYDHLCREYGVSCSGAEGSKPVVQGRRGWSQAWRDLLLHAFPYNGSLELNPPLGLDAKADGSSKRLFKCVGAEWDAFAGCVKLQPDTLWKQKKCHTADKLLFDRALMARFIHNHMPSGRRSIPKAYTWLLEYARSGTMHATGCTVFYVDAKSKETIERIVRDAIRDAMLDKPASDNAMNPCVLASALFHTFGISEVLLVEPDEPEAGIKGTNTGGDMGMNPKDTGRAIMSWLHSKAPSVPDEVAHAAVVLLDRLDPRISETAGGDGEPGVKQDDLIDKAIQSMSCTSQEDRVNLGRLKGDLHAADSLKDFFLTLLQKRKTELKTTKKQNKSNAEVVVKSTDETDAKTSTIATGDGAISASMALPDPCAVATRAPSKRITTAPRPPPEKGAPMVAPDILTALPMALTEPCSIASPSPEHAPNLVLGRLRQTELTK